MHCRKVSNRAKLLLRLRFAFPSLCCCSRGGRTPGWDTINRDHIPTPRCARNPRPPSQRSIVTHSPSLLCNITVFQGGQGNFTVRSQPLLSSTLGRKGFCFRNQDCWIKKLQQQDPCVVKLYHNTGIIYHLSTRAYILWTVVLKA